MSNNLPARLQDVNPFVSITAVGLALIIAIVTIARRVHK